MARQEPMFLIESESYTCGLRWAAYLETAFLLEEGEGFDDKGAWYHKEQPLRAMHVSEAV
jgi:hypothetical protein